MGELTTWRPNRLQKVSLAVVGVLGFAACAGAPSENDSPKDRFQFDYVEYAADNGGVNCLDGTAYDLEAGEQGRNSVTPPSSSFDVQTEVLTITPTSGKNELHLEGFDQTDHRLTPVGSEDQAIFDSYGCEPMDY